MTEKLKVDAHLKDLVEAVDAEPYRLAIGKSRVIEFPSVLDMEDPEKAEFILMQMEAAGQERMIDITGLFKAWLSEKDYQALATAKPTMRTRLKIINRAFQHLEKTAGTPGE